VLNETLRPKDWTKQSLCSQIDPELWFPLRKRDPRIREAVSICQQCPVINECRAYADEIDADYGIWAGELRGVKPRRRPDEIEHGTPAGAKRHWRNGERPCLECRNAELQNRRNREAKP